jgi:hypothetical protein
MPGQNLANLPVIPRPASIDSQRSPNATNALAREIHQYAWIEVADSESTSPGQRTGIIAMPMALIAAMTRLFPIGNGVLAGLLLLESICLVVAWII